MNRKELIYPLIVLMSFSIVCVYVFSQPSVSFSRVSIQGNVMTVIANVSNVDYVGVYFDDGNTWSQMDLFGDNLTQTSSLVKNYQVVSLDNNDGKVNFVLICNLNPNVVDNIQQVKLEMKNIFGVKWIDVYED